MDFHEKMKLISDYESKKDAVIDALTADGFRVKVSRQGTLRVSECEEHPLMKGEYKLICYVYPPDILDDSVEVIRERVFKKACGMYDTTPEEVRKFAKETEGIESL